MKKKKTQNVIALTSYDMDTAHAIIILLNINKLRYVYANELNTGSCCLDFTLSTQCH